MQYLSAEEILVLHALVVDETSGSHGVRDPHLLRSIAHKPQTIFGGKQLYKDMFTKAAVLTEAIVNYHVFVDGNKRTALAATARFLFINGYVLSVRNAEAEEKILAIATKDLDIAQLAAWLKKNTQKLS